MGVMPETFKLRQHDATFSPVALWQFASGAGEGTAGWTQTADSVGSYNLTVDSVNGPATTGSGHVALTQGLSKFIYYDTDTSSFEWQGAMSFACLFKATQYIRTDGDDFFRFAGKAGTGGTLDRFHLYLTPLGHISYLHRSYEPAVNTYNLVCGETNYDLYTWHHIAFTRDTAGTTVKIFLNGKKIAEKTFSVGPSDNDPTGCNFSLGGMYSYNGGSQDGLTMASCVMFNKELTEGEVSYLAKRCRGKPRENS